MSLNGWGDKDVKSLSAILAMVILAACVASTGAAREAAKPGLRMTREDPEAQSPGLIDPGLRGLYEEAAVDTYCLVWYDFEIKNWQGWIREDQTAQRGTFFHVDDFAGLEGYAPLEGAKSMWCGVRPNPADPYLCSWATAPGYGNGWDQILMTNPTSFVGALSLSYRIAYDIEPEYEYVMVEYSGAGGWETAAEYTGRNDTTVSLFLPLTGAQTKLRFRFTSDGAWSDEDGLYNTNGACVIDSISLSDTGAFSDFEDFEAAALGANEAGIWYGRPNVSFGMYSGLQSNLNDKDPCGEDFTSLIVFFIGSTVPSTSYPGLYDTPYCKGSGGHEAPCQNELVISPPIDTRRYSTQRNDVQDGVIPPGELASLAGFLFRFAVYADGPFNNLVNYQWHVRNIENGCPGQWRDRNSWTWGDYYWMFSGHDVSNLIESDTVQVSLGVVDMCDVWYLVNGNCEGHTPTPWFDNVRLYRYGNSGPQWSYRDLDLFQDNFPQQEFDIESYVRADAANDINTNDNPIIRPGDSIVVDCSSPQGGGIAPDPTYGGSAVYLHVKCAYIGPDPAKPDLFGPSLAGSVLTGPTGSQYTIDFNYISDDGVWTIIQCDSARYGATVYRGKYCVDLNDALFTRGYEIEYYFTARAVAGEERALPKWARSRDPYFEWTCLPTKNSNVLFVDDFTGRGSFVGSVENYWMPTLDAVLPPPNNNVDKYDVNGPTSGVSNGPGSRAKNKQLVDQYHAIVWDCGDLESVTITDGTVNSDKSNDCRMLNDWMNLSEHDVGLWICGDDVAFDLDGLSSTPARTLMNTWCGVDFVATSYYDETGGRTGGGIVYPLVTGEVESGIFVHGGVPDSFYVEGGCWVLNQFDILGKTAGGRYALSYPAYNATNCYAGVSHETTNAAGYDARTMWFGFSLQYIRDAAKDLPPIRVHLADDVFKWMAVGCTMPGCDEQLTPTAAPAAYRLAQNYPNPFNPLTVIKFEMKEKGLVTVKIYDVAGRIVRTLLNEVRAPGAHSILWDGRNNLGTDAASGIYFYKMETAGFQATKKLVLLR
jgi:hypothetical protein